MKYSKKITLMLMLIIAYLCILSFPVDAATLTTVIPEKHGTLKTGESKSFNFSIPVDSYVYVIFTGSNDYDEGTYGDYILDVYNQNQENVYTKSANNSFDNEKITLNLSKGNYTLMLTENGDFEFEYIFSIKYKPIGNYSAKTLKLNKTSLNMTVGKSATLKATFSPSYATDNISWSSSNNKVATVSSSGKITAKSLGTAIITCKMGKKNVKCTVFVNNVIIELVKGKTTNITNKIKNIKNYKKGKLKSSNTKVAPVSNYKVKAASHGKAYITITVSGKKYNITTYVYDMKKLKSDGIKRLKSLLKNPSSLVINKITCNNNLLYIDYNAMNDFGGYPRGYFSAWYENGKLKYYAW